MDNILRTVKIRLERLDKICLTQNVKLAPLHETGDDFINKPFHIFSKNAETV